MPRFYVTTPIYYVTDPPHVGTAYCTVNADAIARWHRMVGDETRFLTGTDEHGQKVAESAAEHGVTPADWAETTSNRFVEAWRELDIAYDDYLRTTEPRHEAAVKAFLGTIYERGHIYKGTYRGLYCVSCEDYYTEDELVDGLCPIHGRPVEMMEEENWFFALSAFQDQLIEWYEANPGAVTPPTKRNEALAFIKGGLRDISITRSTLRWGIEVPWDPSQVFYVWYDALVNYLTSIGYGRDEAEVERWWPSVHHLLGKEILRFHCVWWPAMCMAAGIEPPHRLHVHGWLLVGGKKLGKSMAKGDEVNVTDISPHTLVQDYGRDPVRYHLLREVPLGSDGEFSLEAMTARYNSDLANNLGNLLARVSAVVASKCEAFAPQRALEATWRLIGAANASLEDAEPWKLEPGQAVDRVLGDALEVLRIVALLVSPAMPSTAEEIWSRIGLEGTVADQRLPAAATWGGYRGGHHVERGAPLFPRRRD